MNEEPIKISYSSLDVFNNCPKRYEFQIVEKIKEARTKEQIFGTCLHSALKFLYSKSPVFPEFNIFFEYFDITWKEAISKIKWDNSKEKQIYFNEGKRILNQFYDKNVKNKEFPNIIALERRFEAPIISDDKKQIILTGIIDRIDKIDEEKFEIIDYKSSRRMPSEISVENNLQLSIYAIGFLKNWSNMAKIENISLSLYFLKHNEKISIKKNIEELKGITENIFKTIKEIEKEYFPPIPSPLCNFCSYRSICPMWSHLFKQEDKNEEEVKKMINQYFEIKEKNEKTEEELNEIKKQINQYLEKKEIDRVFSDSGFISRTKTTKQDYDLNKVKEILEKNNLSDIWHKILTPDKKKFESMLKTLSSDIVNLLEKTKTKTKTTTITRAVKKSIERIKRDLE
jgi:putative RecB family exonuclease